MKKYTVILDDGYYMEIMADSVNSYAGNLYFEKEDKLVSVVSDSVAWIEETGIDSYWFRHL